MTNKEAVAELSVLWQRIKYSKESGSVIIHYDERFVEALDMAVKALIQQERLTEMLNKQMTAYMEMEKSKHFNDLEYGRKTAYAHCLEVLNKEGSDSK